MRIDVTKREWGMQGVMFPVVQWSVDLAGDKQAQIFFLGQTIGIKSTCHHSSKLKRIVSERYIAM